MFLKVGNGLSMWFADDDDQAAMDSIGNDRRKTHEKGEALNPRAQMDGWTLNEQTDWETMESGIVSLLFSVNPSPGIAPGTQVLDKRKTGF